MGGTVMEIAIEEIGEATIVLLAGGGVIALFISVLDFVSSLP
jgi:hypothetical protein